MRAPAADFSDTDWDRIIDLNLTYLFRLCQRVGRQMIKQKSGKIINIASILSFVGGINVPAYAASKGGVAQVTKALANEWAPFQVNVNAIAPGYIATDLTEPLYNDPRRSKEIINRIPAGRWGRPEDLVGAVVFLASPASDWVHGHVLVVDGGWMAQLIHSRRREYFWVWWLTVKSKLSPEIRIALGSKEPQPSTGIRILLFRS